MVYSSPSDEDILHRGASSVKNWAPCIWKMNKYIYILVITQGFLNKHKFVSFSEQSKEVW